ncbi:hypothetical protein KGQ20_42155 [Catenulispora sp. NF23]|uniref:hypothetical protein n=1 Tax=Catenulispora pinistramenti TaxID=2705254 RepID=UPI001BA6AA66|nr:hypothetical protein [Catenulispora pinistramenti]MBS2539367.1 hypothetical protein [Catenulispora pinistramenti]
MRARFIAVVVVLGFSAGACASATTGSAGQPSASPSPTSTSSTSSTPSTSPHSTTPAPAPAPTVTQTVQVPVVVPTPTAQDPAAVVSAFYAAINAQDYATAWKLGGDNLGFTYSDFAAGFAGTAHDTLTITGEQGNTVDIHLAALQDDGSTKVYDGYYVVGNGQVVEGRLTQTGTISPISP